jgi:hypothetical protein
MIAIRTWIPRNTRSTRKLLQLSIFDMQIRVHRSICGCSRNSRVFRVFRGSPDPGFRTVSTLQRLMANLCPSVAKKQIRENSRHSRIQFKTTNKETKSRFSIFKIFMRFFQTHRNPENPPHHKTLTRNIFCQNIVPKSLTQLSESLRLDGRTIDHHAIFPNTISHYRINCSFSSLGTGRGDLTAKHTKHTKVFRFL